MGRATNIVMAKVSAAATAVLRAMAKEAVSDIKSDINTPWPPPSKPGSPPHRRSGTLWRSIKMRTKFNSRTSREVVIFSDQAIAKYNAWVEATRPYIAPARKRLHGFAKAFESRLKTLLRMKRGSTGIDAPSVTVDTDNSSDE